MAGRSGAPAAGAAAGVMYDVGSWRLGDDGAIYRRGRLKYANGDVYDGEWLNGKRHGQGSLTFASAASGYGYGSGGSSGGGGSYVGGFAENLFEGFGVLSVARRQHPLTKQWLPGERYEGDFVRGRRHGHGTAKTRDGDCYTGAFADGYYHGKGSCVYANGDAYDGEWVHGKRQGHGELRLHDGSTYVGAFHQDAFHGFGRLLLGSGGKLGSYVGDFVCGKREGKGVRVLGGVSGGSIGRGGAGAGAGIGAGRAATTNSSGRTDNQRKRYEGEWADDEPHGVGVVECASYTLVARFVRGQASGHGTMAFANGERYEGDFLDGHFHGVGAFVYRDGGVYEGDFVQSKRHGAGRRVFASGDEYVGDWADDRMHGRGKLTSTRELSRGARGVQVYDGAFACGAQTGDAAISYTFTPAMAHVDAAKSASVRVGSSVGAFACVSSTTDTNTSADADMAARFAWTREYEFPPLSGCWHCGRGASTYVGGVLRGAFHGAGELRSPDGKLWRGAWVNGRLSGVGERVYLPLALAAVLEREKDAAVAMARQQQQLQSQRSATPASRDASSSGRGGDSGGNGGSRGEQPVESDNSNNGASTRTRTRTCTTKLYRIVQYEGEFADGVRHGIGKLLYENGDRVLGRFVNGAAHGVVAYRFAGSGKHRLAELEHGQRVRWLEEQSEESVARRLEESGAAAATATSVVTSVATVLDAFAAATVTGTMTTTTTTPAKTTDVQQSSAICTLIA